MSGTSCITALKSMRPISHQQGRKMKKLIGVASWYYDRYQFSCATLNNNARTYQAQNIPSMSSQASPRCIVSTNGSIFFTYTGAHVELSLLDLRRSDGKEELMYEYGESAQGGMQKMRIEQIKRSRKNLYIDNPMVTYKVSKLIPRRAPPDGTVSMFVGRQNVASWIPSTRWRTSSRA